MDDDEMMWDDDVWNYVVLCCVDTVMKWYELLWKWTVVNDGGGWYDLRCVCV